MGDTETYTRLAARPMQVQTDGSRIGTTAEWVICATLIPAAGQECKDLTAGTVKLGDGTKSYAALSAIAGGGGAVDPVALAANPAFTATYGRVIALPDGNGVDDTAVINALLATAGGSRVRGVPGQTYRISDVLVLPQGGNVELDMTGCTIQAITGFASQMLTNWSSLNPAATNHDAPMTAGSNVVNFPGPATTTGAFAVGQTAVVDGAQGSASPLVVIPLVATITAVGASSITLDKPAKTTTPAWSCNAYVRDKNIRVIGGNWRRGAFGFTGAQIRGHSLMFRHVDNLRVDIEEFQSTGIAAHFPISAADFTNGWFRLGHCVSGRDGIHLMGPFRNAHIESIDGVTADDMLSVTTADYGGSLTDSSGDCIGLSWGRVGGSSTAHQMVKLISGRNCHLDAVRGGIVTGTCGGWPVWVGEDTGQLSTMGGTYGSIDVGVIAATSTGSGTPLFLASPQGAKVSATIATPTWTGAMVSSGLGGSGGQSGGVPSTATLECLDVDYASPGTGPLFAVAAPGLTIREVTSNLSGGLGFPATVDPGMVRSADAIGVFAANAALFARVREGGRISKIGMHVTVSSGNVSVAAYRNTGAGRSAAPAARLATSGAVACPAIGYAELTLDSTVIVRPGDWLCVTADNTTARFRSLLGGVEDTSLGAGRQYRQAAAHPAPATPSDLQATIGATAVLVGVE